MKNYVAFIKLCNQVRMAHPDNHYFMTDRILKIAHRGYSEKYPENTIPAFIKAIEFGADMIEFDIHLSRDGRIVVIHDDSIDRTSNGTGMVKDFTLNELREYDYSFNFGKGMIQIPTLEEVLELSAGKILLNIEIKNCPNNYAGIEKELVETLTKFDSIESAVISSFDHHSLLRMKGINRNIKTGMLYDSLWIKFREEIRELDVYSLHPGIDSAYTSELKWASDAGYKIYPWVAKSRKDMDLLAGTGWVHGIMVNDLRLFRQ